jgi:hypothetical protein
MILGHLGFSYLLAQLAGWWGVELSAREVILVVITGSIVDIDLFVTFFVKKGVSHHNFVTHTPLGAFLIWLALIVGWGAYFSLLVSILLLAALLGHLALDDLGYWLSHWGFQNVPEYPRTNWLYPFRKYNNIGILKRLSDIRTFKDKYLKAARASNICEIALVLGALIVGVFG